MEEIAKRSVRPPTPFRGPGASVCQPGPSFFSPVHSPHDLTELAVGWLYNQGFIESVDEVVAVDTCEQSRKCRLISRRHATGRGAEQKAIRTSACGGGEISSFQFFRKRDRLTEGPGVCTETLQALVKKTLSLAIGYRRTGGIHCASLASPCQGRILALYEDIGRHNAVDKVVGRMLLTSQNPEDRLLLTTGRVSSEMALKVVHSGIPIIATITTCTDLALQIAEEAGLTIVTRALTKSPAYCAGLTESSARTPGRSVTLRNRGVSTPPCRSPKP